MNLGGNSFRCDSATYVDKNQGCVFDQAIEFQGPVIYDPNAQDVDEAAEHVYDALYRPERTFPLAAGKSIPGSPESGQPLTQIRPGDSLIDSNRYRARQVCVEVWGAGYSQGRLYDCDEFPYATTYEGANNAGTDFSARVIDAGDNQAAGNELGRFHRARRILENDPFFVVAMMAN